MWYRPYCEDDLRFVTFSHASCLYPTVPNNSEHKLPKAAFTHYEVEPLIKVNCCRTLKLTTYCTCTNVPLETTVSFLWAALVLLFPCGDMLSKLDGPANARLIQQAGLCARLTHPLIRLPFSTSSALSFISRFLFDLPSLFYLFSRSSLCLCFIHALFWSLILRPLQHHRSQCIHVSGVNK